MPDDIYVGELRLFGGNFAPVGWFFCNGQLLSIADYSTLFALIGTTYGGDGTTTFGLPNLQGRVPIHNSSTNPIGTISGAEQVTLTTSNLPPHTHAMTGSSTGGSDQPGGNTWGTASTNAYAASAGGANVAMSSQGISTVGNNLPHDNMIPILCVSYIISYTGIFPSQG
jgi:microcystin-dependent protein